LKRATFENYFDMKRQRRIVDGNAVSALACPYCGEEADLEVEDNGPSSEEYVEDCPVCCRPWTVRVSRTDEGTSVTLDRGDS
jgi:hypothetical protein